MKLCLGTVQFGMDYGIRDQKRPTLEQSIEILNYAYSNGITAIDTASAYGNAESILGKWLQKETHFRKQIHLITKSRPKLLDNIPAESCYYVLKKNMEESLSRLRTDYLDGYLLHDASYVFNDLIIEALCRLKKEGYVREIGVSIYETEEAKKGITRGTLDFIQLPYSIFDQRMLQDGVFRLAETHHFSLHARSAFIQGLIPMEATSVPPFLEKAKPILQKMDTISQETGFSRIQLALAFVKQERSITHLVFGVDNLDQLKEDIALFEADIPQNILTELAESFSNLDTTIVRPNLWKREENQ